MKKVELVFIPLPGIGHLVSTVEIAKLLIDRDDRLSITVLIMLPFVSVGGTDVTQSLSPSLTGRIRFVDLPQPDPSSSSHLASNTRAKFLTALIEHSKPHVKDAVHQLISSDSFCDSTRLAGFVLDMFCTSMIDVANEFGVPSYAFFTSTAGFLGLMFHLQTLHDHHHKDITEFKDSDDELVIPNFLNPVPVKVLPSVAMDKEGGGVTMFLYNARRLREMKGIMINTFAELESHAVNSFLDGKTENTPPIYPVGPILNLKGVGDHQAAQEDIMSWLGEQPSSSVVFLCFGSMGGFGVDQVDQVKEIARGLERSNHRFLWSLRQPQPKGQRGFPRDYTNPEEVLPEGFLERTAGIGKVIGWAPQVAVLSHPAVGGFVSHCGWNSTLESLWCGVPVATWPMYAEQQLNAFQLVRELGLAVEVKLDYRNDSRDVMMISGEEIEGALRGLMEDDGKVRKKVKEMGEKCREALMEGGSSYSSLGRLIEDVMTNMPST